MNESQTYDTLAALREAYDWLENATFDRLYKSQKEFDDMMDRIEAVLKAETKNSKLGA